MYKKILVGFALVGLLAQSLILPNVARAEQAPWYAPDYQQFNDKVRLAPPGEIFGERYTHAQVWWIIYSLMSFAIERKVSDCVASNSNSLDLFINCVQGADASTPSMASGGLGFLEFARLSDSMIVMRPASGVVYVASLLERVGISSVHAQEGGFGFNTLSPVLGLWRASRNASYALVTLAVVLLAFMVMFRARISPQASVSVMSAIPRIIVGLLLITFSFAIAGFVIDLSYVVLGVIAAVVQASGIIDTGAADTVGTFNMLNDIGGGIFNFGMAVVFMVVRSFGNVGGAVIALTSGFTVPVAATLLVLLLALILIIVAVIRIFWVFLRTYVMVILHVVALPFAALVYIASPSGNMFMQLLRSLVGNVSVFVSVALTVMLAHILLWGMSGAGLDLVSIGNVYHIGALSGGGVVSLPGFSGGADASTMGLFVGIVVILMGPSIANNIKSFIISGRPAREGFSMMGAGLAGMAGGYAMKGAERQVLGTLGARYAGISADRRNMFQNFILSQAIDRGHLDLSAPSAKGSPTYARKRGTV